MKKDKAVEKRELKKQISQLESLVEEHKKSEETLRNALRQEYDNREKWIEEQTAGLITANIQLRQEITDRKKAEEALHYRIEFERLITELSTNFIKLSPDEIDNAINMALQTIGEFVGVDRSYVFLFSDQGKIGDIYEWCAKGIEPQVQYLAGRSINEELPWFTKKINKRGVFHISSCEELPPEAIAEKHYFKSYGIQSLIAVPMFCGKSFIGFVCFDSVRTGKTWAVDIIGLLRIVGEIFANALERKRMDVAIRENENKYQLLFEYIPDGIAILDKEGCILECNHACMNLFERSQKEILRKSIVNFLIESDKAAIPQKLLQIRREGVNESEIRIMRKDGKAIPIWCKTMAIFGAGSSVKGFLLHCRRLIDRKQEEKDIKIIQAQLGNKVCSNNAIMKSQDQTQDISMVEIAMLNAFDEPVFIIDTHCKLLALNDQGLKDIHRSEEAVLGLFLYDILPRDFPHLTKTKLEEITKSAKPFHFKERIQDVSFSVYCTPIFNDAGDVERLIVSFQEIEQGFGEADHPGRLLTYQEEDQESFDYFYKKKGKKGLQDIPVFKQIPKTMGESPYLKDIISRSSRIRQLFDILPSVAESVSTVLLQGESGTGKHLFAQAIHNLSPRRHKPFIVVNCGALPDTLLESELFGYKAGAFTDAKKDKPGRFALANGGTLFLDEIGDISPAMQVRLLRFLQERIYEPLGSVQSFKADVRIIAATNKHLTNLVKERKFREDLFYRINVVRLDLPPLRERLEDVPILADTFIEKLNTLRDKKVKGINEEALICLLSYDYPGNIRELENIIERAFVLCDTGQIEKRHLPEAVSTALGVDYSQHTPLMKMEAAFLMNVLRQNNWSRLNTARQLGIHKATLFRKIKSLGLKLPFHSKKSHS